MGKWHLWWGNQVQPKQVRTRSLCLRLNMLGCQQLKHHDDTHHQEKRHHRHRHKEKRSRGCGLSFWRNCEAETSKSLEPLYLLEPRCLEIVYIRCHMTAKAWRLGFEPAELHTRSFIGKHASTQYFTSCYDRDAPAIKETVWEQSRYRA